MRTIRVWVVSGLVCLGCDDGGSKSTAAPAPTVAGESVLVAAGEVTLGFHGGTLRATRTVGGFRISKTLTSAAQMAECRDAGVCSAPTGGCEPKEPSESEQAPALCSGRENATKFCEWAGGRLPRLNEWLAAARGAEVQKYAWGATPPTCRHHPLGQQGEGDDAEPCAEALSVSDYDLLKHSVAASVNGLEDVLLLPTELIAPDQDAVSPACQSAECLVYGLSPAAIESARPFAETTMEGNWDGPAPDGAYGFRCVWEVAE